MDESANEMKNKKQELLSGILLTLAFAFMLMIYSPIELYFTNKNEFWFDITLLFSSMFFVFLMLFAVLTLTLLFIAKFSRKLYRILVTLEFSAFICAYIQGNFLVNDLPPLDGRPIEWNQYSTERIKSILLWTGIMLITMLLVKVININKTVIIGQY